MISLLFGHNATVKTRNESEGCFDTRSPSQETSESKKNAGQLVEEPAALHDDSAEPIQAQSHSHTQNPPVKRRRVVHELLLTISDRTKERHTMEQLVSILAQHLESNRFRTFTEVAAFYADLCSSSGRPQRQSHCLKTMMLFLWTLLCALQMLLWCHCRSFL